MRKLLLVLLVCATLMPALPASTAQPPDSNAPYMYYYAPRLNAYVIERADGTDSRLFGEGLLKTSYLTGPGWSPSGEWFAAVGGASWNPQTIWSSLVLNINNQDRITVFDDLDILWMEWANGQDILIAATVPQDVTSGDKRYNELDFYVVDVPHNSIISSIHLDSDSEWYEIYFQWHDDGERFSISYTGSGEVLTDEA